MIAVTIKIFNYIVRTSIERTLRNYINVLAIALNSPEQQNFFFDKIVFQKWAGVNLVEWVLSNKNRKGD